MRQHYSPYRITARLLDIFESLTGAPHRDQELADELDQDDRADHDQELEELARWLRIDRCDRRAVNRQLAQLAQKATLSVMTQMAKGFRLRDNARRAAEVIEELERLKWLLWHGNVFRAVQTIDDLQVDLDAEDAGPEQRKLLKAITEFGGYIRANASSIPNYGERYRAGEAISSAFVESTVNQVISKRMVKKQQMRWTPKSAHLLLQVRTKVLNEELAGVFQRWYPAFVAPTESPQREALSAA